MSRRRSAMSPTASLPSSTHRIRSADPDPAQRHLAARYVARQANDDQDLSYLLDVLDLTTDDLHRRRASE